MVVPFILWGNIFIKDAEFHISEKINLVSVGGYGGWEQIAITPQGEGVIFAELNFSKQDTTKYYTETPQGKKDSSYILGPPRSRVLLYETKSKKIVVVASSGEKPHQASFPFSIANDSEGNVYIGDNKTRRVSIFDNKRKFLNSFIVCGDCWAPVDIEINSKSEIYLAGLKLDPKGRLNSGDWITKYDFEGNYLKSFAYTPDIAFRLNLWEGISPNIEIDENDLIYLVFAPEYKIYVYDSEGNLKKSFGQTPDWFVYPKKLPLPVLDRPDASPNFWKSFTSVVKLLYLGNHRLLVATRTNGLVKSTSKRFILDIYNTVTGKVILSRIETDYFPFGTDDAHSIYFVSPEDGKVFKTHLKIKD